jgi:hypothetical protein
MKQIITLLLLLVTLQSINAQNSALDDMINPDTLVGICGNERSISFILPDTYYLDPNGIPLPLAIDSIRIDSIVGLPPGLSFTTDVISTADAYAPYGYWTGMDTTSVNGVVSFTGSELVFESLEGGGPNNDGVYPVAIYKAADVVDVGWIGFDGLSLPPIYLPGISPETIYLKVNPIGDSYTDQICMISVDTVTGKNQLSWEKTLGIETDYFKIYKQNNTTSNYDSIGSVHIDSLSTYVDVNSNPDQSSDRYRISLVKICGNETVLSDIHRTIHLSANQGLNEEVNLSWNPYEGFSYSNFEIWRSTDGSPYTLISTTANNNFSFTDVAPPMGDNTYRVAVLNPNGCNPTRAIERAISNVVNEDGNMVTSISNGQLEMTSVFPNPSSGIFTVNVPDQTNIQASVFDALGKLVTSSNETGTFNLDLSDVPVGIYTLRLDTESGSLTKKLVRE